MNKLLFMFRALCLVLMCFCRIFAMEITATYEELGQVGVFKEICVSVTFKNDNSGSVSVPIAFNTHAIQTTENIINIMLIVNKDDDNMVDVSKKFVLLSSGKERTLKYERMLYVNMSESRKVFVTLMVPRDVGCDNIWTGEITVACKNQSERNQDERSGERGGERGQSETCKQKHCNAK